jgi:hypothetical protein
VFRTFLISFRTRAYCLSLQGRPFLAQVGDTEGAQLPGRGAPVADAEVAAAVVEVAKKLRGA